MKSSSSLLSLAVIPGSEVKAWSSICSVGHGEGWSPRQEEMWRLRLAPRVLGRERREDAGVVLLDDEEDEEDGWRVRACGLWLWLWSLGKLVW